MNKKIFLVLIFAVGVAVGGAGLYLFQAEKNLSSEEAAKIAIDFINNNIKEEVTASLLNVAELGDIYKISLKIAETEYESYITKDGTFLFPTGINLGEQVPSDGSLVNFAQCIADTGAKFYGASWCSHCKSQKEMFGEAAQYLPYIECSTEDGEGQLPVCKDNNITSYPTWEFAGGSRESGEVSLQKLAEKTGCQLPE